MNQEGRVTIERQGHVLLIGLDRVAKRNAFDQAMLNALALAYAELEHDDELRCGVLFAHGDHFTAGLELTQFASSLGRFEYPEGAPDPLGIHGTRLTKPLISAVQGICLTIGIELMLATDIRIAASNARFAQIEIKRGLFPFGGATIRLPREIGWGNAMRYLLTGDEFDADEAFDGIDDCSDTLIHEELLLLAEHPDFDRDVAAHPALPREPVSLSHRVGFARHSYDETKRGNVTDGRTPMAGCHIG